MDFLSGLWEGAKSVGNWVGKGLSNAGDFVGITDGKFGYQGNDATSWFGSASDYGFGDVENRAGTVNWGQNTTGANSGGLSNWFDSMLPSSETMSSLTKFMPEADTMKGLASLAGTGAQIYGAVNQNKLAEKSLDWQKQMYADEAARIDAANALDQSNLDRTYDTAISQYNDKEDRKNDYTKGMAYGVSFLGQ